MQQGTTRGVDGVLGRLCLRHRASWLWAALHDASAPDPVTLSSTRRAVVAQRAASCDRCRARGGSRTDRPSSASPVSPGPLWNPSSSDVAAVTGAHGWSTPADAPDPAPAYGAWPGRDKRRDRRILLVVLGVTVAALAGLAWAMNNGWIGPKPDPLRVEMIDLRAGDCVQEIPHGEGHLGDWVDVVKCTAGHQAEVVGWFNAPDGDSPGATGLRRLVTTRCGRMFAAYVGVPAEGSVLTLGARYPSEQSWVGSERSVDRRVVCTVSQANESARSTGSLRGAQR